MTTPVWPTNLNYLVERGSFRFGPTEPQLRSEFDYGPARMRRRFTQGVSSLGFEIVMRSEEFEAFKAFYHRDLFDGVKWFEMNVYLGEGYLPHKVRFTEPYQMSYLAFRNVKISAKLEVRRIAYVDEAYVYLIGEFGDPELFKEFADPLQVIVNEDYPAVMEDY